MTNYTMKNNEKFKGDSIGRFHMELLRIRKRLTSVISGVICIYEFSKNEIIVLTHGGKIKITGDELSISVFENQTIEIKGKAENICFE